MSEIKEILNIFKKIASIPHCSGNTKELQEFIINWCKNFEYEIKTDKAGNILAYKGSPILCLQSHIDMVCVGDAPNIEIIEEDGWLRAKNSSLGADNGIGVAIMLYLISKNEELEFLFTNDEEIGLIGAFNLDMDLKSKYLLNLDSEDDSYFIIGCAGGVDVLIEYPESYKKVIGSKGVVKIENLKGGHSGVDIHKNIPNAIVEILKRVEKISYIKGGERRNSIPANAQCIEIFDGDEEIRAYSDEYLHFLRNLPHGVLEYDFRYDVVSKSINFALVDGFNVTINMRANSDKKLEELKEYILTKTKEANVTFEGEYPAWEAKENEFTKLLQKISNKPLKVIHAGLECAVLYKKYPHIQMASYGPLIENPHSVRERVKIDSIKNVVDFIFKLLKEIK